LISGPVSVGKTTLASGLEAQFGLTRFKTIDLLSSRLTRAKKDVDRRALQIEGEKLDKRTKGDWVAQELTTVASDAASTGTVVVDAVRILPQIEAIRGAFGSRVIHVHLTAREETLARRYRSRRSQIKELANYAQVRQDPTEGRVETLASQADLVIDTSRSPEQDVVVQVAAYLGLYSLQENRLVDVLVGGQYGSEGKGNVASYLAKEYDLLVRVGGPNAGHKVFLDSGVFTHRQLPSGTLTSEARLLIGPGAVLDVRLLLKEIADCNVELGRLFIDPNAMIISEKDISDELELVKAISSTGKGVGAATARRIMGRSGGVLLAGKVPELAPFIAPAADVLEREYTAGRRVLLEGTQGTALSLFHGTYPFVTSRDTTVSGCLAEAGISPIRVRRVLMVCRTYPIRVPNPKEGTSGPLREISLKEIARRSGKKLAELRATEKTSVTNLDRRIGEFDWALLRRATALNTPTDIALTFADYLSADNESARRFDQLTAATIEFIERVERVASAPVSLISTRFHYRGIIDRRSW